MTQEEQDRERSSETISGMFHDGFLCPTDKQLENATVTHSRKADRIMLFGKGSPFRSRVSPMGNRLFVGRYAHEELSCSNS